MDIITIAQGLSKNLELIWMSSDSKMGFVAVDFGLDQNMVIFTLFC